jgi:hypothetical protein
VCLPYLLVVLVLMCLREPVSPEKSWRAAMIRLTKVDGVRAVKSSNADKYDVNIIFQNYLNVQIDSSFFSNP